MRNLKDQNPFPKELIFLSLSLDNLTTIKPAVEAFTATESKPDVLFNNAGVSLRGKSFKWQRIVRAITS